MPFLPGGTTIGKSYFNAPVFWSISGNFLTRDGVALCEVPPAEPELARLTVCAPASAGELTDELAAALVLSKLESATAGKPAEADAVELVSGATMPETLAAGSAADCESLATGWVLVADSCAKTASGAKGWAMVQASKKRLSPCEMILKP